jgi:hypothetical protein
MLDVERVYALANVVRTETNEEADIGVRYPAIPTAKRIDEDVLSV